MAKYSELKKQYPEFVTKEQLYKIARISKEHAKWLLDEGVIPCADTGKKTRKYKIAVADIIRYLKLRDKGKVPRPVINKRNGTKYRSEYCKAVEPFPIKYAQYLFSDAPDVITTKQFCVYTKMSYDAARRKIQRNLISAILIDQKYYVLKLDAIKYAAGLDYAKYLNLIKKYDEVYTAFVEWGER